MISERECVVDSYSGTDVLESLIEAKNYNRKLTQLIKAELVGRAILDFGAGTGDFASSFSSSFRISTVEPDKELAKKISSKGLDVSQDLSAFPVGSFTTIYSLNVLEHIENDIEALRQIGSRLALGGKLVLFVPANPKLYSSFDKRIGHFRRYTKVELISKLVSAGFAPSKVVYFDFLGFFAALVYKLLDNGQGRLNSRMVMIFDRLIFPLNDMFEPFFRNFVGKNLFVTADYLGDSARQ